MQYSSCQNVIAASLVHERSQLNAFDRCCKGRIRRVANRWSLWSGYSLPRVFQRTYILNRMAAANYKPQPYSGRVTLFRSADFWGSPDDPSLGWNSIVGRGVNVHEVPGDHRLFREPHVQVLAAQLRASLEQTQARPP